MATARLDPVKAATYDFGKRHGLSRKTNTMWLDLEETIGVVNLQRSIYGPRYYVNVALWLRPLGDEVRPLEHGCPVRAGIEALVENPGLDYSAFDLESDLDPSARATAIWSSLAGVLGVLRTCSHVAGLLQPPGDQFLTRGWVHVDARQRLASIKPAE